MNLELILALYSAVLGAVVGSYLNVVIHRLPRGEPTAVERSRCPRCGAAIRPWHNIPILGFLMLAGRCRDCKESIHWRYLLVEGLGALLFLACFRVWGPSVAAVGAAIFGSLLLALAAIDLEHLLLPNRLTIPGAVLGLVLQPWLPFATLRSALFGVVVGVGIVVVVGGLWYALHGSWGIGFGDAKLLGMIGAFLGWKGVFLGLAVGAGMGSLIAVVGLASGRLAWQSRLPFGSFLAVGGLAALFASSVGPGGYWGLFPG